MKKIIEGLKYDTETAEEITEWSNHYNCTDFNHYEETLFRTKNGRFFLYGNGNANSPYAKPVDNMRGPGADIVPLSDEEAIEWLERRGKYNTLERLFPEHVQEA